MENSKPTKATRERGERADQFCDPKSRGGSEEHTGGRSLLQSGFVNGMRESTCFLLWKLKFWGSRQFLKPALSPAPHPGPLHLSPLSLGHQNSMVGREQIVHWSKCVSAFALYKATVSVPSMCSVRRKCSVFSKGWVCSEGKGFWAEGRGQRPQGSPGQWGMSDARWP